MNKAQRKRLEQAIGFLDKASEIFAEVREEEQDKFDNLPEGLQQTEANQKLEEDASTLETYLDDIETIRQELYELAGL